MPSSLVVRNIDQEIVRALKRVAAQHGRSAEAEHREILRQVLQGPKRRSFAEFLQEMPNVGLDSDFESRDSGSDS